MTGQIWATNSLGGFMYADKLSDELRTFVQGVTKFRQFCDAKDANKSRNTEGNKLGKGDAFHWNIYSDLATQGTKLTETSTVPETGFTISQGTLTIDEWANAVPYSGKLDNLSEQPIREIIKKGLKNDVRKAFDTEAHAKFNKTLVRVVPASSGTSTVALTLTENGTCTGTNTIAMGATHVKLIVDTMKERNIPPYTGDDYVALANVSTYRPLKNVLETLHQYTSEGFKLIHNGEIGRYENVRFVEQTFIKKGISNNGTAWSTGLSDWCYFFGEDTVAEGIVVAEELRGKLPGDFGRSKGIAWYALLGFEIVHNLAAQSRIVKWDSAA